MLFKPSDDRKGSPPPLPITRTIPLLPLRDIIVFPHMVVPLFVGREKSIKALEESMRHEKEILLQLLRRHKGNRTIVADKLAISRRTIQRKIKDYRLPF